MLMLAPAVIAAASTSEVIVDMVIGIFVGSAGGGAVGYYLASRGQDSTRNLIATIENQERLNIKTRQGANGLVQQSQRAVSSLLNQSQRQQRQTASQNKQLAQHVQVMTNSSQALARVTNDLQQTTTISHANMVSFTQELDQLRTELGCVNQQLRQTQTQLAQKEHDVSHTLAELDELQQQLSRDTQQGIQTMHALNHHVSHAAETLSQSSHTIAVKDREIATLRAENARLIETVAQFESTMSHYAMALNQSKQSNIKQIAEIRRLLENNMALSEGLNHPDAPVDRHKTQRGVRMFSS